MSSGAFPPAVAQLSRYQLSHKRGFSPQRVTAGHRVRVFGLAGGCPKGDAVTLLSTAFPSAHEFAGIPAVYTVVDGQDSYSTHVIIPSARKPGKYSVSARCGGGNFGAYATFRVQRP